MRGPGLSLGIPRGFGHETGHRSGRWWLRLWLVAVRCRWGDLRLALAVDGAGDRLGQLAELPGQLLGQRLGRLAQLLEHLAGFGRRRPDRRILLGPREEDTRRVLEVLDRLEELFLRL